MIYKRFLALSAAILCFACAFAAPLSAQELVTEQITVVKAKVVDVVSESTQTFGSTDAPVPVQELRAEILEGEHRGDIVEFRNDYVMLEDGDTFYLSHTIHTDGREFYLVFEPNRLPMLTFFLVVFIVLVLMFGGIQGLRGLLSLAGSLLAIIFLLLPGIIQGFSPLLVSIGVSSLIIILGSYITHGFNKTTSSAVLGMIATVVVTGIMGYFAIYHSHLTGVTGDEEVFLNYNLRGNIDLLGLLMGGIMIGLLGVLYDSAIGQSIAIEELHRVAPHLPRWTIYKRAIRIGREHIGALVNTLAIAYVGASLPLMLLFYSTGETSFGLIVNREIFATEIMRILIGSIGLVLAVPITTLLGVLMLVPKEKISPSKEVLEAEKEKLDHFNHTH